MGLTTAASMSAIHSADDSPRLKWTVHLLLRRPAQAAGVVCALAAGTACVWALFHAILPVLVANILIAGSAADFLFPVRYSIDSQGVSARSATGDLRILWSSVRRCLRGPDGIILTSLPAASRLDGFRGVMLRYASDGAPGDRKSVDALIAEFAPGLRAAPPELSCEVHENA